MVSSIGGSSFQRPDPTQIASKLFSKLDTKNQGYIEKSDLQSAFDQIASSADSSSNSSVDDVFKQLDSNSDGKVTKQELTDSLKKIADQLDSQFQSMRTKGMNSAEGGMQGMDGMPPPPPPQDADSAGFTKDELQSQLNEIGSSDSKRASLISNIVSNFDKADTDGDGKVSMKEAMAFDKAGQASSSTSSSTGSSSSSSVTSKTEANVMMKIMQLMQAYGGLGQDTNQSSLSVSA